MTSSTGPAPVPLRVLALNCSLTPSPGESSTQRMIDDVLAAFTKHDVTGATVRLVDHPVRPGVENDMGDGDAWPPIRRRIYESDILLMATPTWLGHMSSEAQRALERLDAELSETDDEGRPALLGKVAVAAVVGNEDGAHKIIADLLQALDDVGFTVPAQGAVYWNGEAMSGTDYKDLDETPEMVAVTARTLSANASHLARLLAAAPYPPPS